MNASELKRRWFIPTPGWLVLLSLATTGFLFVSERYKWFAFNQHKGYTALIAVASVFAVLGVMLFCWLAALVFRWQFQFGIRSLLVLTVATALPLSWLGMEIENARDQKQLIDEIEKSGGYAVMAERQPQVASSLGDLLGKNFFGGDIVAVGFPGSNVTNAALEKLRGLTKLQVLDLSGTQVSDAGLENLRGFAELQNLYLYDTNITSAGLVHLRGLAALQTLLLNQTKITDAGLEQLRGLTALRILTLHDTEITDAGLENLRGLTELRILRLGSTRITDAGLKNLRGLTALTSLDLVGTTVTDGGAKGLCEALPDCKINR